MPTTSACGRWASTNSLNRIASLFFFGSSKMEYGWPAIVLLLGMNPDNCGRCRKSIMVPC
jgi:hypothetical protein